MPQTLLVREPSGVSRSRLTSLTPTGAGAELCDRHSPCCRPRGSLEGTSWPADCLELGCSALRLPCWAGFQWLSTFPLALWAFGSLCWARTPVSNSVVVSLRAQHGGEKSLCPRGASFRPLGPSPSLCSYLSGQPKVSSPVSASSALTWDREHAPSSRARAPVPFLFTREPLRQHPK